MGWGGGCGRGGAAGRWGGWEVMGGGTHGRIKSFLMVPTCTEWEFSGPGYLVLRFAFDSSGLLEGNFFSWRFANPDSLFTEVST